MMEANRSLERDFNIASECGYSHGKPLQEITRRIQKARISRLEEKEKASFPVDPIVMSKVRELNRRKGH